MMLSDLGGGGGSSFRAGTGEYVEGDASPRPNELPYSLSSALTISCRELGAVSPRPCGAMMSVMMCYEKERRCSNVCMASDCVCLKRMVVPKRPTGS